MYRAAWKSLYRVVKMRAVNCELTPRKDTAQLGKGSELEKDEIPRGSLETAASVPILCSSLSIDSK
jgi:hypothetical protein